LRTAVVIVRDRRTIALKALTPYSTTNTSPAIVITLVSVAATSLAFRLVVTVKSR